MSQANIDAMDDLVLTVNADGSSSIVLVCEHASSYIPAHFDTLGLSEADRKSHAAWDPGAMAVAESVASHLDAPLIASGVSRLVYDCNRPPSSEDAMPACSEIIKVPGNQNLSPAERADRTEAVYRPFHATLHRMISLTTDPVIVTLHSFTPVYHGLRRVVEIGVLHDSDTRLADALLDLAPQHTTMNVQRNAPYGPEHGVTHTLREHGVKNGHLNVMLEIRNDLIATAEQQEKMAALISGWIAAACAQLKVPGDVQCRA